MRNAIIRHKHVEKADMTYEEMHAKYQQILNPPPAPPPTNAGIMTAVELTAYAAEHNLPLTVPCTKDKMRQIVQAHMNANRGKSGGKKRTLKKKRTMKKKRTLKK